MARLKGDPCRLNPFTIIASTASSQRTIFWSGTLAIHPNWEATVVRWLGGGGAWCPGMERFRSEDFEYRC